MSWVDVFWISVKEELSSFDFLATLELIVAKKWLNVSGISYLPCIISLPNFISLISTSLSSFLILLDFLILLFILFPHNSNSF